MLKIYNDIHRYHHGRRYAVPCMAWLGISGFFIESGLAVGDVVVGFQWDADEGDLDFAIHNHLPTRSHIEIRRSLPPSPLGEHRHESNPAHAI